MLQRLWIRFKSFPDKVKITFDEGVTGVVGPNGSGKSNLSDAVRWVLGETSARQLRAAGKMEDVIFGGTRRRGAMGFAQVRLTLDNSSHALDVEADEVTIGRRPRWTCWKHCPPYSPQPCQKRWGAALQ